MTDDLITKESVINEIARFRGYLDDDMIYRIQTAIKRKSTVEAIPMEWIMKYYEDHPAGFVTGMIYDWAMEQAEREEKCD